MEGIVRAIRREQARENHKAVEILNDILIIFLRLEPLQENQKWIQ